MPMENTMGVEVEIKVYNNYAESRPTNTRRGTLHTPSCSLIGQSSHHCYFYSFEQKYLIVNVGSESGRLFHIIKRERLC